MPNSKSTLSIAAVVTAAVLGFSSVSFANTEDSTTSDNDGEPGLELGDFVGGDRDKFKESYDRSGRFERMDTNEDGSISRDEQMDYEFSRFDGDRDGNIDDEERDFLKKEYEEETIGGNPDGQ